LFFFWNQTSEATAELHWKPSNCPYSKQRNLQHICGHCCFARYFGERQD